ncbi:MAG TPA: HAMP domain-containing histidine kinase [Candidatus Eisenbergiella merdipullorum]|uniref:histidine kinase n=1 Tax=Candidatus Eisenbergiella merdipullorum TaxID=2838553 RepID=A0A9D2I7T6_9FIRM|nr:HAMP domain-containing histidine kinase [Candidatus Eisenbergiella merdipullorum]
MSEKRKQEMLLFFPILVLFLCMSFLSVLCLHVYRQTAFEHISAFCETVIENSPEAEPQILAALKEYHSLTEQEVNGNHYLLKYGYRPDGFCRGLSLRINLLFGALFLITACAFVCGAGMIRRKNQRRIDDLTGYLEQVNTGAGGTLMQTKEDDFAHLQDEIYKTVTALVQTKESAVAAKKRFAENLANIAHQLKTPITAAFLSLQMMKKEAPKAHAEQIKKQLERLNRLEESLLTLSGIDAGTLPMKCGEVDIYTALNLAAENLSDLLQKEKVSVEIPDKGCIVFWGDLEWTMEALLNLMKNCLEHSPSGGRLHCDYSGNPLYAQILIWDEGRGFDPADMPHLFERFYRGRNAAPNGIGIGLALARSVFELQNGTITARNLPNGGACFEIRIYSH